MEHPDIPEESQDRNTDQSPDDARSLCISNRRYVPCRIVGCFPACIPHISIPTEACSGVFLPNRSTAERPDNVELDPATVPLMRQTVTLGSLATVCKAG
jgi:hypothetical protein